MIVTWTQGATAQSPQYVGAIWTWAAGDGGEVAAPVTLGAAGTTITVLADDSMLHVLADVDVLRMH